MPNRVRFDPERQRQRWKRRLSAWGFVLLVLAALAVVSIELLN